eukprot:1274702-Pleurochrysis_carterae.AAC.1
MRARAAAPSPSCRSRRPQLRRAAARRVWKRRSRGSPRRERALAPARAECPAATASTTAASRGASRASSHPSSAAARCAAI